MTGLYEPPTKEPLESHVLGDDRLAYPGRSAVDPVHPVVRVQPGDRVLGDDPVAAVQLQAAVDNSARHLGAEQLRGRRVNRIYGGTSEVMKTIIAKDMGL